MPRGSGRRAARRRAGADASRYRGRSGRGISRRLPALNGREVIRALEKAGFVIARIKGSHHFMVHREDKTRVTNVPAHASQDLPRGTLRDVIKQAGLTVDEFLELL